jgi:hypothetical protein
MYVYPIHMSTFKRLSRLDLKIYEIGHQECLNVMLPPTKRIISRKYNIYVKPMI